MFNQKVYVGLPERTAVKDTLANCGLDVSAQALLPLPKKA